MVYEAKENFSGVISMCVGEKREISDDTAKSLLEAGYIVAVKPAEKAKTVKGGNKNGK